MNINSIRKIFTQPPMQLNFIHHWDYSPPQHWPQSRPTTKFSPFIRSFSSPLPPSSSSHLYFTTTRSHFCLALAKIRLPKFLFPSPPPPLHSISRQPSRKKPSYERPSFFLFLFPFLTVRKSVWRTRISLPGEKLYCWHIFKNSRSSLSRRSTASERPPRSIT